MAARTATYSSSCPLCPRPIVKGSKVLKNFESGRWAHQGCQIGALRRQNPSATEGEIQALTVAPSTSEGSFMGQVRALAEKHGWLVYHSPPNLPTARGSVRKVGAGFPDLTLVHPETGQLVFAELKSEDGRVTEDQQKWMTALQRASGVIAVVWRPADLPSIHRTLESYAVASPF